jgi:hypothetical protein
VVSLWPMGNFGDNSPKNKNKKILSGFWFFKVEQKWPLGT